MSRNACQDFHHASEASRRSTFTRRQALRWSLGAGLAVYAQRAFPFADALDAAAAEAAGLPDAPILVSVFLPGGLDLLDTIVPVAADGRYRDLRGGIAVNGVSPLASESALGLAPALSQGVNDGLRGIFDRGQLGLLPGIDYADPNMSHFASRVFWETGMVTNQQVSGWLGRWLDRHGSSANPFQGMTSGYGLSPLLRTAGAPVASMMSPTGLALRMPALEDRDIDYAAQALAAYGDLGAAAGGSRPGPRAAAAGVRFAHDIHTRMQPLIGRGAAAFAGPVSYPQNNDTAVRLSNLAAMLAQPLGIRIGTVEASGGWDTHANQNGALAHDLGSLSEALSAFQADLEARGLADRVLTLVWSEFGRRPTANKSMGTDHGAAGVAWVMGARARSGVLSDYPSLTDLDANGNMKVTVDFRTVYASLIAQWLQTDPAEVIPDAKAFGQIGLVA
ncbi:MAG: hypothetical protein QOK49_1633 [Baekduia sp.]|nr:hypothetical protein [Baekduia sp.]